MLHKVINHGQSVRFEFGTNAAAGSRVDFSNALEAADIRVYKNSGTTERSSTAGFTVTSGFDSMVGVHFVVIDTSDNTDAGFFVPGSDYVVVLYPDETVDSLSVAAILGTFSINPRTSDMPYVGVLSAVGSASSITLPAECPAVADVLIGCLVKPLSGTGKDQAARMISAYTSGRVATLDPAFTTTPDTTTYVGIMVGAPAPTATIPAVNTTKVGGTTQTAGDLAALVTTVDTVVDAVKAKTDNLPSDPADASVVAGLIAALETKVDTVDTVADAIKAKTDNLPSDPADASVLAGLIGALPADIVQAEINALDGFVAAATTLLINGVAHTITRDPTGGWIATIVAD